MILISGSGFTGSLYVLFGGQPATGWAVSSTMVTVVAPPHVAGLVDVEVGVIGKGSVVYPGGYEYRAPAPGTGTVPAPGRPLPTEPDRSGGTTPPPPGTTSPTTTTTATTMTTTTTNTTAPPTTTAGSTTTVRPAPTGAPTRFTFGAEEPAADNGLRLRPVTGGPSLAGTDRWAALACTQPVCAGTRL
jgi:hypothetical protein